MNSALYSVDYAVGGSRGRRPSRGGESWHAKRLGGTA